MNRRIIDYRIKDDKYFHELEQKVMDSLKNGWEPFGSLQITKDVKDDGSIVWHYFQPIVSYDNWNNEINVRIKKNED